MKDFFLCRRGLVHKWRNVCLFLLSLREMEIRFKKWHKKRLTGDNVQKEKKWVYRFVRLLHKMRMMYSFSTFIIVLETAEWFFFERLPFFTSFFTLFLFLFFPVLYFFHQIRKFFYQAKRTFHSVSFQMLNFLAN